MCDNNNNNNNTNNNQNHSKLFGCCVHDSIRVSSSALKIINTPEFQRMRQIKQLGLCHHVYPSATHTRFEHSIGVYHLAGIMVDKIQQQYPNKYYDTIDLGKIQLTCRIGELIKIAGLCHDIGHGPFSHIFDDILLKNSSHPNAKHEIRSVLITEMLCKRELPELSDKEISFIQSIIKPNLNIHTGALYQIVSNSLNGIDVDKFDYLVRDTKCLGLQTGFNPKRLINEFIIDCNDNIAYPKHCSVDIYEMFHSRYMMHKKVYSHKTVKLIEVMLSDLFIKVDNIFGITVSINDMEEFCKLTDQTVFNYIEIITTPPKWLSVNKIEIELDFNIVREANQIYQQILSRKLYQLVMAIVDGENSGKYIRNFLQHLIDKKFDRSEFHIIETKIGFVSDTSNPFDSIFFYDKKENDQTFVINRSSISSLLSNRMQEMHWYLVCRNRTIYPAVMVELQKYMENEQIDHLVSSR